MSTYNITGGTSLYGSVRPGGAKNASFKLMIACLLCDSQSRLLNFSHISDVSMVARLINNLGGKAANVGDRAYVIDPHGLSKSIIEASTSEVSRASTLFIPILLTLFGKAVVPFPGGDKIGARPLDRHFDGLKAMGATIQIEGDQIVATCQSLHGAEYTFEKNTHTGTETLILAAVRAQGKTILRNAALETEIDDLITFLNSCGAKITRLPGRIIEIEGVASLHGSIHKILSDRNQAVSFACAAIATKGDIIVEADLNNDLAAFLEKLDAIGAGYEKGTYGTRFYYKGPLKGTNITTKPHPGFMTDWGPLWVTLATQCEGESILHETVYESRFAYVESLKSMGADITLFDPQVQNPQEEYNFNLSDNLNESLHAAKIKGITPLRAGQFTVKDLRHGATLMIAGMLASGNTILHDPEDQINRGYESLHEKFIMMGAKIEKQD